VQVRFSSKAEVEKAFSRPEVFGFGDGDESIAPNIWRVSRRAEREIRNLGYIELSEKLPSSPGMSASVSLLLEGGLKI